MNLKTSRIKLSHANAEAAFEAFLHSIGHIRPNETVVDLAVTGYDSKSFFITLKLKETKNHGYKDKEENLLEDLVQETLKNEINS